MKANKHLLLWSSLGALLLLIGAAYHENFAQDWRLLQNEYRELLPAERRAEFPVQLRQIVTKRLGATDRCISCHAGMAPGETGIKGHPVFAPHPKLAHDPAELGCTICHGGQGRATVKADAHGAVAHWPEPLLPRKYSQAGCGSCHTHLAVPNLDQVRREEGILERHDCLACHRIDGRGGTVRPGGAGGMEGPDLSLVGLSGFAADWYERHLRRENNGTDQTNGTDRTNETDVAQAPSPVHSALSTQHSALAPQPPSVVSKVAQTFLSVQDETQSLSSQSANRTPQSAAQTAVNPWQHGFAPIAEADRAAIEIYLRTRTGAPQLIAAKALFHSQGCRGCHKIGGVGGDDGPELTAAGLRDPGQLDFKHVRGEHTFENWLKEHFRAPALVVSGSQMPVLGLSETQIEQLTFYLLSLRRSSATEGEWPLDRVRAERLNEREFATDGATLYRAFCSACHGAEGEGMRYPGMPAFPAIGNPEFLAIASDDFIRQTIQHGRTGRRMPAWGDKEGGLRVEEIDAIIAHLRELPENARLMDGMDGMDGVDRVDRVDVLEDAAQAGALVPHAFDSVAQAPAPVSKQTAAGGEGEVPAEPQIVAQTPPSVRESGSALPSPPSMASITSTPHSALRIPHSALVSQPARWVKGDAALGGALYRQQCAACHGPNGEGLEGPALANAQLQAAATDTYFFETIRRGRPGTSMPAFGKPSTIRPALNNEQIEALVTHIRTWEKKP